jgi:hypothetical protein
MRCIDDIGFKIGRGGIFDKAGPAAIGGSVDYGSLHVILISLFAQAYKRCGKS